MHARSPEGINKKVLCYLLGKPVGNTKEILLFSLRTIREAGVDIVHHMDQSLMGISAPLLFLKESSTRMLKKKKKIQGDNVRVTKNYLRGHTSKVKKIRATENCLIEQASKVRMGGISPIQHISHPASCSIRYHSEVHGWCQCSGC